MSQVSLPMRIALLATLAFSAVWLVALRPKSVPEAATPAAAQSAPGKAAEQAKQAVETSQQGAAKHEAAADAASGAAAGTSAAAPAQAAETGANAPTAIDVKAAAGKDASKALRAVLADIAKGKVVVLLFWDRRVSDDRAVHVAVQGLSARGGKVSTHAVSLRQMADFEPITRGVPVVISPTVLIIDRARRARSVSGLSTPAELDELVGKALRVKP